MSTVAFQNPDIYAFAQIFADQTSERHMSSTTARPDDYVIDFSDPRVGRLFHYLSDEQPTVLPFPGVRTDSWLITGPVQSELDAALIQVGRFVVPSYAAYATDAGIRRMLEFDPSGPLLQQLGARLGLPGYYRWESPSSNREIILNRLSLWGDLAARRPPIQRTDQPTYAELEEKFREALVLRNWTSAESTLTALRRLNVTSAENLVFLEFVLAARQQQWQKIWEHPNFEVVAQLRLPRAVKSAMFEAVHQVVLRPMEERGDWDATVRAFDESQPRLGRLLVSRAGLRTEAAIRVFAYQAVTAGDARLMDELLAEEIPPSIRDQIQTLAARLSQPVVPTTEDPESRFRTALEEADVDSAYQITLGMSDPVRRLAHLVEVAIQSRDELHVREALRRYDDLPHDDAARLERAYPIVGEMLTEFREMVGIIEVEEPTIGRSILSWADWLGAVATDPRDPRLPEALDHLSSQYDEREWAEEGELERLFYGLVDIQDKPGVAALTHVDRALTKIADMMMTDEDFPRTDTSHMDVYGQLFDVLLLGSIEPARATRVTDLAAAILETDPHRIDEIAATFVSWYARPQPRLEEQACAIVEVLADYGVTPETLAHWYRSWAEYLLILPTRRDWTSLATWRSLGNWTGAAADLVARFDGLATTEQDDDQNPISELDSGFCIVLFTLRPSSANRVKDLMLEMNQGLDVQICTEKDLDNRVIALARRADLPVIVTSCITHALTYGVEPYLRTDPVFPQSSGSVGILRAIEERLAQLS